MKIDIDDDLKAFLESEVKAGRFKDVSEAVNAAIRGRLEQRAKLETLRKEIQVGIDDLDAGRVSTITREEVKAHIRRDRG